MYTYINLYGSGAKTPPYDDEGCCHPSARRLERRWAKDRGISHAAKGHLLLGRCWSHENNMWGETPEVQATQKFQLSKPEWKICQGCRFQMNKWNDFLWVYGAQTNKGLEDHFSFQTCDFQVSCLFAGKYQSVGSQVTS